MKCIGNPSRNMRDSQLKHFRCYSLTFRHCFKDENQYNRKYSVMRGLCGYIDSLKLGSIYKYTWRIQTSRSIWIHFNLFDLYFNTFPCSLEYVLIHDALKEYTYCGKRLPWNYYSKSSAITFSFHSDQNLHTKGKFQIFFQDENPIDHAIKIKADLQGKFITTVLHPSRVFFFFVADRTMRIQLYVESNCSVLQPAVYDGPGVKSPRLPFKSVVNSTAFLLLLVVNRFQSLCLETNFRFIHDIDNAPNCFLGQALHYANLKTEWRNYRCKWTSNGTRAMLRINRYILKGADTLLDNEICIFGGIFVFAEMDYKSYKLLWSGCTSLLSGRELEASILAHDKSKLIILLVDFQSYSMVQDLKVSLYYHSPERKCFVNWDHKFKTARLFCP